MSFTRSSRSSSIALRAEVVASTERGQSTVELALCLPILALLVAALVQVGVIVADQARLWHAAREAARVAVVEPDPTRAEEVARSTGLSPVDVTIDPPAVYRRMGEPLTVSLSYQPTRVPLVSKLFGDVTLHARATMRIEQP
jgi:TadE-like protein